MCGQCCGAWKLPVEDDLYTSLNKIDWVKNILKDTNTDFECLNDQRFLPKSEGICVFLDKTDNCCLLHKKLGPNQKPIECNRFPFAFARDKEGNIYVDTSFYCKAISENIGPKVNDLINEEYIAGFDVFEISDVVAYSPVVEVNLNIAIEIRQAISKYLYDQCIHLSIEDWVNPFISVFQLLIDIEGQIKKKQEIDIEQFIQKAGSKTFDQRMLMFKQKILTAFLLRKYSILPDVGKLLFNCSKFKEPIVVEEIDLKQYKCVTFASDIDSKSLLLKYLLDINQRTILLGHGHCLVGIYIEMFVAYCLLKWYMKALAIVDQSNISEGFHIKLAIRIVERYYIGHNVRFLELFRKSVTFIVLKSFLRV